MKPAASHAFSKRGQAGFSLALARNPGWTCPRTNRKEDTIGKHVFLRGARARISTYLGRKRMFVYNENKHSHRRLPNEQERGSSPRGKGNQNHSTIAWLSACSCRLV